MEITAERCCIEFGKGDKVFAIGTDPNNHNVGSLIICQMPTSAPIGSDPSAIGVKDEDYIPIIELLFRKPESLMVLKERVDKLLAWMQDGTPISFKVDTEEDESAKPTE